jgi:hypothetical protein
VLLEEWFYRLPTVIIHGNANGREAIISVPVLELHVPRDFNLAAMAPSRPEIKQDYFAFIG